MTADMTDAANHGIVRWVLGLIYLGYGGVLLQPGATFGLSRAYGGMARLMSEDQWALTFIAGGLLILGSLRARGRVRAGMTFMIGASHAWIAVSLGRSADMLSLGAVNHCGMVLLAWWLLGQDLRVLRQNAVHLDA